MQINHNNSKIHISSGQIQTSINYNSGKYILNSPKLRIQWCHNFLSLLPTYLFDFAILKFKVFCSSLWSYRYTFSSLDISCLINIIHALHFSLSPLSFFNFYWSFFPASHKCGGTGIWNIWFILDFFLGIMFYLFITYSGFLICFNFWIVSHT